MWRGTRRDVIFLRHLCCRMPWDILSNIRQMVFDILSWRTLEVMVLQVITYFDPFERWLAGNYKQRTVKTYMYAVRRYLSWYRPGNILTATGADLDDYVAFLVAAELQQTTINTNINGVRQYYEYLAEIGKVDANPVLRRHVQPVYLDPPIRFDDGEISQALAYLSERQSNIYCAFLTMFATGARIDEVAHLRLTDFSWREGVLYVSIHDAKYASDRDVPFLQADYAAIVGDYLQGLVMPEARAFRVSARTLQRYAQMVSDECQFHFFCHRIRHTVAEIMIERGYSLEQVQGQLGHANIRVTSYYAKTHKQVAYVEDLY